MKISVLLATYSNDGSNQKYLELCLNSVLRQTHRDFEIILVASGDYKPHLRNIEGEFKGFFHYSKDRLHFPKAIETAYRLTDPTSDMIFLLNDDAILDPTCLDLMGNYLKHHHFERIVNALCNSDSFGFLYEAVTGYFVGDEFNQFYKPQFRLEDFPDGVYPEKLYKYPFAAIPVKFNPFYATMMRRSTYDKVGGICPDYLTNLDDLDFALRAQKLGIHSYTLMHAAVFHFGGVTSSKTKTQEEEDFNRKLFEKRVESLK